MQNKNYIHPSLIVLAIFAVLISPLPSHRELAAQTISLPIPLPTLPLPLFLYTFNSNGTLQETGSLGESSSSYFWLNSGGALQIQNGVGQTLQGSLPEKDRWRRLYSAANPVDTDNGYHPQNLFRLLTKNVFENVREEAQFKITADNWSKSPNRNASNGLLLFGRYNDESTLYYAGIRVDGTAVIKKKYKGTYYTMAQKSVFPGTYTIGGRDNLLPHNEWLGLRNETVTNADGSVTIRLYMQRAGSGWTKLLEATDNGKTYGNTPAITTPGAGGIRTDFMDVQFDSLRLEKIAF